MVPLYKCVHTYDDRTTKVRPRVIYCKLQRPVQLCRAPENLSPNLRPGKTRIHRLHHIGTTSSYLYLEALKAAIKEARAGKDVKLYELTTNALYDILPNDPDAILDIAWVDRTNQILKAESTRLELELKGYKNNLIKESIRVRLQS